MSERENKRKNDPTPPDIKSKLKVPKTPTNVLRTPNISPVSRCQKNTYSGYLRSYKSISFHIPKHRPFLTLKNNKQLLNYNQNKIITTSINKNSTHFCFRLHSHTISYPYKQLHAQSYQQKPAPNE